ncbi:MAG: hypothetical protein BWK76_25450 [Desulfobulbaceae bacterium A2]|nr:MAG: hypothetical protein BWK76_25450 [Desulfobulbaceae bacterium A2]
MAASAMSLPVCSTCGRPPQLTESQLARVQQAYAALAPGKSLNFACPGCRQPLSLTAPGPTASAPVNVVVPPPPPSLAWMDDERFKAQERASDVPGALILCQDPAMRQTMQEVLTTLGYQVRLANSVTEALDVMRFQAFGCVALHTNFEGNGLEGSRMHEYMRHLAMTHRRSIFYILIGPKLRTLYDLQALAFSANLTVAEGDLPRFAQVLSRAIPAHEELFGPLVEELGDRLSAR